MKSFWSITRWIFLGTLGLVLLLLLTKPATPVPKVPAESHQQLATQFEQKLEHLEQANTPGESGAREQFNADEVNAGLDDMTANGGKSPEPGNIKIVGVNFVGDEAVGQCIVNRFGKELYVTMTGHLSARNGYANIELTSVKIGRLSVPVALINPRLQQRLAEPEQRERLKLPDFIADLRVEDGKLVVVQK